MFCENCGAKLSVGALYCEQCGKKVTAGSQWTNGDEWTDGNEWNNGDETVDLYGGWERERDRNVINKGSSDNEFHRDRGFEPYGEIQEQDRDDYGWNHSPWSDRRPESDGDFWTDWEEGGLENDPINRKSRKRRWLIPVLLIIVLLLLAGIIWQLFVLVNSGFSYKESVVSIEVTSEYVCVRDGVTMDNTIFEVI